MNRVRLGERWVGSDEPCVIVAEAGQNHNGDCALALRLVELAKTCGADAVKFQIRTPELAVPKDQWEILRETPWGDTLSYFDYRRRMVLGKAGYDQLARGCGRLGFSLSASGWDIPSLDFLLDYNPPWIKLPSACLTDLELLEASRRTGLLVIASTGMSDETQIARAVSILGPDRLVLLHCTSTYPVTNVRELNLRCIQSLQKRFQCPTGFSDHSTGMWAPLAAAVLGAAIIEKHVTWSRAALGTDHAASVEPDGLARIVRYVRQWEAARGDGIKTVYDSERPVMARLRRVP